MTLKDKKIGLISLGCDKNRVDSERVLAIVNENAQITNELEQANIVIINTCAFLESARYESIETIMEVNSYRQNGKLEKIVLTGCLPQKFINEIFDELIEVDVFLGFLDYDLLFTALEKAYQGERVNFVGVKNNFYKKDRILTTVCHYSYLKIADGCNNKCTYCLIPSIRGKYTSTEMDLLIEEAKGLGDLDELILVAQDVTRYGIDIYNKPMLVNLLQELSKLENISKIRILYAYPDMISDELILEIKSNEKIIKYIDIPLQHADNKVLKLMNRKGSYESYLSLINKLRQNIPNIAIRSTFITGFPGETEESFNNLVTFIKKAKFTNCGFFAYSREEGTPAYKLPNQVDEEIKIKRVKKLYSVQKAISKKYLQSFVGKSIEIICDGIDYDKQCFVGRAYFNAPDIDGKVYFTSNEVVNQGERYNILVTSCDSYDLYGKIEEI